MGAPDSPVVRGPEHGAASKVRTKRRVIEAAPQSLVAWSMTGLHSLSTRRSAARPSHTPEGSIDFRKVIVALWFLSRLTRAGT